jgi:hypothetical protein
MPALFDMMCISEREVTFPTVIDIVIAESHHLASSIVYLVPADLGSGVLMFYSSG